MRFLDFFLRHNGFKDTEQWSTADEGVDPKEVAHPRAKSKIFAAGIQAEEGKFLPMEGKVFVFTLEVSILKCC